jgi:hypothetical protein
MLANLLSDTSDWEVDEYGERTAMPVYPKLGSTSN